jgi:hypothetical protein
MLHYGLNNYLPAAGCEVHRNPRLRTELPPLVVFRNPSNRSRGTPSRADGVQSGGGLSTRDGGWIDRARTALHRFAGRGMPAAQTAPRFCLADAGQILGVSVAHLRELATRGRITETWEMREDGSREQMVRADDLAKLLSRRSYAVSPQ